MSRQGNKPSRCLSPFKFSAKQLLWFLAATSPLAGQAAAANQQDLQLPLIPQAPKEPTYSYRENFRLRTILHHGTYRHPGLLRKLDVPPTAQIWLEDGNGGHVSIQDSGFPALSAPMHIQRLIKRSPSSMASIMAQGRARGYPLDMPASAWAVDKIKGPNITDKETIISFAKMASNAYVIEPSAGGWEEVGGGFNSTEDFGWEGDGLRGHIFADSTNRTIVIGLKGTSPAVFDGAETTTNDKINDNLFFSCCCAQGGSVLWHQVCDCKTSTFTCNSTCLVKSLQQENRYYFAAKQLYHNVTALYPDADVWITGHSLGGSVSSLLGITYGLPAISFEAPGDAMAASRLGLPTPPGFRIGGNEPMDASGIYHFGHTGDPVFTGNCASCTIAGYAMESVCHTGKVCRYDTVKDLGFHSYIGNHRIASVIKDVLEAYDVPAPCEVVKDCTDCFNWKFYKSNSSSTTTTSSSSTTSSYTRTRTETCQTPGWFGCLDKTTTSKTSTPSTVTTTTSTSTCETPGWFGCLDPTTTTITKPSTTLTSTCETPGWFGCNDPTTTTSSTSTITSGPITSSSTATITTSTSTSTTCHTPFFFWCLDKPTASASSAARTSLPSATPGSRASGTTPTATVTSTPTCKKWWPWSCDTSRTNICEDSL